MNVLAVECPTLEVTMRYLEMETVGIYIYFRIATLVYQLVTSLYILGWLLAVYSLDDFDC